MVMTTGNTDSDCEKGTNECQESQGGYDRISRFMGDIPEVAIFHRFAHLSAESLLHYQAEIYEQELKLAEYRKNDREANPGSERWKYAINSGVLRDSVNGGGDELRDSDPRQWETILRIRELLKEYCKHGAIYHTRENTIVLTMLCFADAALVLHHQVVNLNKPHRVQLQALKNWMGRPTMGNMFLTGDDSEIWNESKLEQLVTMERSTQDGVSSSRSTMTLVKLYHQIIGRHIHVGFNYLFTSLAANTGLQKEAQGDHLQNTIVYHEDGVFKLIRVSKALAACMLPIVGIVVLYIVKNMAARLGIIAGFTAIFSLTLCYFTSASIKDVFSATAA